ncbi:MAG: hypothetical protein U0531_15605 [Dehalococcoidia bacterium]
MGYVQPTMQTPSVPPPPRLFRSFWIAGFESASHINRFGARLDMIGGTQHDVQADHDYALLRALGISAARDGVRWHLIERPGGFDFRSLAPMTAAARRHGVQIVWTLCHYGWPDDLDPFAPAFVERFARFCRALARFIRSESDEVPFYTPINELSFLSWAAGDQAIISPFGRGRGWELKKQLVRAAIAGMEAVWDGPARAWRTWTPLSTWSRRAAAPTWPRRRRASARASLRRGRCSAAAPIPTSAATPSTLT